MNIVEVHSGNDVETVSTLAKEIWSEHFTPIIGKAQVNYMLEKFQSREAIRQQLKSGSIYLLVEQERQNVGYAGLIPDSKNSSMHLSKLYLQKAVRGQGLARELMRYIEALCQKQKISRIWLTVNRHNTIPIAAYEKMGFITTSETVQDIGAGYVMDDFIMEKQLSSPT